MLAVVVMRWRDRVRHALAEPLSHARGFLPANTFRGNQGRSRAAVLTLPLQRC